MKNNCAVSLAPKRSNGIKYWLESMIIEKIAILIFAYIVMVNMIPAVATHDTATIQKAAGRTIEQITDVTNEVIEEITIDTAIDKLMK